jgi:very-short-patch-repair endonuclease
LGGLKFRRQQAIGGYVADFFCAEAKMIVEIDSVYHEGAERRARDDSRDRALAALGVRTLRITASTLARDRDAVLATILREAKRQIEEAEKE